MNKIEWIDIKQEAKNNVCTYLAQSMKDIIHPYSYRYIDRYSVVFTASPNKISLSIDEGNLFLEFDQIGDKLIVNIRGKVREDVIYGFNSYKFENITVASFNEFIVEKQIKDLNGWIDVLIGHFDIMVDKCLSPESKFDPDESDYDDFLSIIAKIYDLFDLYLPIEIGFNTEKEAESFMMLESEED